MTKHPNIYGSDQVYQAVEDIHNGNRTRFSRAVLQSRIAEIRANRSVENERFEEWKLRTLRVKE